jgi:hypothetical protein
LISRIVSRTIEQVATDKKTMRRVIAITATVILGFAALASAQTSKQTLADVAKAEEARRKAVPKTAKVYTNGDLETDISKGVPLPPTPATPAAASKNASPANATPGAPGAAAPAGVRDQAYWAARMKAARDTMDRQQIFADSLQSRINALTTDFVNRDDPAQKAKIETDRKAALAELERVRKELEEQAKAITAIEDEARRAGVPPGWLRPGA